MIDDKKTINAIQILCLDMINNAGSGHPGISLGAASIMHALFAYELKFNASDPTWINRDRFVMSCGHGSALLYSTLFMHGYPYKIDDLCHFRQINSITPGHPEYNPLYGVEFSSGPLGQGIASSVGIALGERYLHNLVLNQTKENIIDYYTFCLVSDGDLMEGVSLEAISFAGTQELGKLIVLYDSNDITLDGSLKISNRDNNQLKFSSMNWDVQLVKDGNSVSDIVKAIEHAKQVTDKPSLIEIKTTIGCLTKNAGTNIVHGKPILLEEINDIKKKIGFRDIPFDIPQELVTSCQTFSKQRNNESYQNWQKISKKITNQDSIHLLNEIKRDKIGIDLNPKKFLVPSDFCEELRQSNNKILNIISEMTPLLLSLQADTAESNKTYLINSSYMKASNPMGKNVAIGVREHAMAAIMNGLSLAGLKVFGSTFLSFSDYAKPAIRMSSLMKLPVTYTFTHDSIKVGQDGPTHQPIEQLGSLRSIPNFNVYRPADLYELVDCYHQITNDNLPAALIINKEEQNILTKLNGHIKNGAHIVLDYPKINGIIMTSGSELEMALRISNKLSLENVFVRIISVPCLNKFVNSSKTFQRELLPIGVKSIALELSNDSLWHQFIYNSDYLININEFGKSGLKDDVLQKYGFDEDSLLKKIKTLLQ